jgi:hypothetical protein
MKSTENANDERHYLVITVAVIFCIVGVYMRFADFKLSTIVANAILVIGAGIALKGVFGILE